MKKLAALTASAALACALGSTPAFAQDGDAATLTDCRLDNLVVLWSVSKIFGMPGLRAGLSVEVAIDTRTGADTAVAAEAR